MTLQNEQIRRQGNGHRTRTGNHVLPLLMFPDGNYNHANPFGNERERSQSVACAIQPTPARQCRCTSATTPRCQRNDAEDQRDNFEASAWHVEKKSSRCLRFVAPSALRLDIAGCSCLSRWLQRGAFTNSEQRAHKPRQGITTSRAQRIPTTRMAALATRNRPGQLWCGCGCSS